MKVVRTELQLDSRLYAREYYVERSLGCHLMQVVHAIQPHMDPSYKRNTYTDDDLQNFALPGFLWEHVMDRAEQLEVALSHEAVEQIKRIRKLDDGGEMFWCKRCDDVMWGHDIAREHCGLPPMAERTEDEVGNGHTGIFWTPDARNDFARPVEFKVTWVSANRTSESSMEIWKYVTQTRWQAWGYGADGAEVYACFVNGDYSYPLRPQTFHFDIEYTERELRNNFSMIVSNAVAKGMLR